MNKKYLIFIAAAAIIIVGMKRLQATKTSVKPDKREPVRVESNPETQFNRLVLTEQAVQRLGIQTTPVRTMQVAQNRIYRSVVPYASLLYGLHGETWVYTSPEPFTYVRQSITVETIQGDLAILSEGPAAGTLVATVGVAELYGADTGVGK